MAEGSPGDRVYSSLLNVRVGEPSPGVMICMALSGSAQLPNAPE